MRVAEPPCFREFERLFGAAEAGLNGLELPAHVIAEQLGHGDGGTHVTQLYGHPDARRSSRKIHKGTNVPGRSSRCAAAGEDGA